MVFEPGSTMRSASAGTGVPGGVRLPAITTAAGVFKASYAFLEPGKFDVQFLTQAEGNKVVTAKRTVVASSDVPPAPSAPPSAAPTASVKWM